MLPYRWDVKGRKNMEENKNIDEQSKQFSQADFDREISKMYEKFEQKFNKRQEEADKLAAMNAEEKYKYQLQQKEKELSEREKQWALKENKYNASKILAEKSLPIVFADFIIAEDAATMQQNINLLDAEFRKAVKIEVEKRLGSTTPNSGTSSIDGQMTKEEFKKLSLTQMQALANDQPELFKKLTQGR